MQTIKPMKQKNIMVDRHFSHIPTLLGFVMLFGGLVAVIGSTQCYQWWSIPSSWVVIAAVIAFGGFILFYKGLRVTLSNWYWWHFGAKGTLVGVILLSIVLIVGWLIYEGSISC